MAKKKEEEEIQLKLKELEDTLKEEAANLPASKSKATGMSAFDKLSNASGKEESGLSSDFNLLGGGALVLLGIVAVMSHIHVSSGWGFGPGAGEGGLTILGIVVGLGMVFYNYKNLAGWLVLGGTIVGTILLVLSRLRLMMDPMNLIGLIFIFLPFALGAAMIAKGLKGQKKAKEDSGE